MSVTNDFFRTFKVEDLSRWPNHQPGYDMICDDYYSVIANTDVEPGDKPLTMVHRMVVILDDLGVWLFREHNDPSDLYPTVFFCPETSLPFARMMVDNLFKDRTCFLTQELLVSGFKVWGHENETD